MRYTTDAGGNPKWEVAPYARSPERLRDGDIPGRSGGRAENSGAGYKRREPQLQPRLPLSPPTTRQLPPHYPARERGSVDKVDGGVVNTGAAGTGEGRDQVRG